jgi:indolepyruvate ferredoxin oxidoreductase alpha subunit
MTAKREDPAGRPADPLLTDGENPAALMLGDEAIVRGALEAGVAFASGYPGTPSSEVTDSFARVAEARGIEFEYSVNEKVALEMAFAASLAGARSICAMKHLGLMYAGDPLSTIPYVGVVGGMVMVSAGDPSCHTSPNEQDQRRLGEMLHIPTLDPSTPQEAYAMTRMAFDLSERSRLPVLLRITTRVAHTRAIVRCGRLRAPRVEGFVRDPERFVPMPQNARKLRLQIQERLETARGLMTSLFRKTGSSRQAILASGPPAATCADLLQERELEDRVTLATLGGVYPLPEEELLGLMREVDRILVVEELSPFIEDALRALCTRHGLQPVILGKRTGHFPFEFEYTPEVIQRGIHEALGLGPAPVPAPSFEPVPSRPPSLCPGCPHRSTYFAARAAFGDDQLYFNDIGCYTLGYASPLNTADALLCMGAGFTLAAGVSRVTGKRTVGFLGDSTFFHSGMPGLLNAVKENANLVAVILDNQVTAMTGFQESPTSLVGRVPHTAGVSIEGIARALGVRHVETIDPMNLQAAISAFERARDAEGVSVIIAEHPCPVHVAREGGSPYKTGTYEIDHDRCQCCGRESCGLRCGQCVMEPFERNMARTRVMEIGAGAGPGTTAADSPPVAPCATRCPLGLCIQGYAGHIAAGQYREALDLIMSRTPLPESVCRVCHRPCEEVCIHVETGEPVAINDLKRFVVNWAGSQEGLPYDPPREPQNGMKVAVVGAGPAGLAAAHDLRIRGYEVTLFDASEEPGGLLLSGIPRFRLPREALQRDVARILGLGVRFCGGTVLGKDLHVPDLLAQGFQAVFLALGASRAVGLSVPGHDGTGPPEVVDALTYLAGSGDGQPPSKGRRVVVVGGGNAAFDSARTALRRGAEQVVLAYRRDRGEMPALRDEIEAAEEEGVELRMHLQPVGLHRESGGGLVCVRTEPGEPDASGRRSPVPVAGSDTLIEADQVIVAIGQTPDAALINADGLLLELAADGTLLVDPETTRTSHPKIFAGGDLVPGPRTVTEAIAWGQRAAWGIDGALRGREAADRKAPPPRAGAWPEPAPGRQDSESRVHRGTRQRPAGLPAGPRAGSFDEVVGILTEAQATAEASRCASCGQCGNCRACLDLFGCPAFYMERGRIHIDPRLCNGCGVCAHFCPNSAIRPVEEPGR